MDTIGTAGRILAALGDSTSVVDVGAGTGSYEPRDRVIVALEPSRVMMAQRARGTAPAVRGVAEALPFRDGAFDAAMALLTVHHWSDFHGRLREMQRVARRRVVVLTWDPAVLWEVRASISALARLGEATVRPVVERLAADLRSGEWDRRYGHLRTLEQVDLGYRLVVARRS